MQRLKSCFADLPERHRRPIVFRWGAELLGIDEDKTEEELELTETMFGSTKKKKRDAEREE